MSKIFDFTEKEFGLVCCGEMIMRLSPLNNEMLHEFSMSHKHSDPSQYVLWVHNQL